MNLKIYLWIAGMFFVGGIIYSIFGLQIAITKKCAMKLFAMVKTNTECWYPDACLLYFKKVKRRNVLIVAAFFIAALFFIPKAGTLGLVVGYFLRALTTSSRAGLNQNNLSDCIAIFKKFAKPGMEEDLEILLDDAIYSISANNIYKSF